jgi:hypothetical protein
VAPQRRVRAALGKWYLDEETLNTRYDVTIPWNDASSYNDENLIRRCYATSVVVYNDGAFAIIRAALSQEVNADGRAG